MLELAAWRRDVRVPDLREPAAGELDVALVERRIDLQEEHGLFDVQHLRHDPHTVPSREPGLPARRPLQPRRAGIRARTCLVAPTHDDPPDWSWLGTRGLTPARVLVPAKSKPTPGAEKKCFETPLCGAMLYPITVRKKLRPGPDCAAARGTHYLARCDRLDRIGRLAWAGRLVALRGEGCRRCGSPCAGAGTHPHGPRAVRRPPPRDGHRTGVRAGRRARRRRLPQRREPVGAAGRSSGCSRCSCSARTSSCSTPSASGSAARSPAWCWRWRCSGPRPPRSSASRSALVDALRRRVRGTYLLNNLLTYTTFPLLGGIVLSAFYESDPKEGGYARRRLRRLPGREPPELPDDRRPHAHPARRLAARDVPRRVRAGAAVGGRVGGDDRDGRLRLRGLRRRRSSASSRSRSASTSCCCGRCWRARRTRRRSSAAPTSSTSATRACSGCCSRRSRCATRAPPATPPPSPTTRTSSPARPGSPSASRRSSTPPACCTTSARRRCPTTS